MGHGGGVADGAGGNARAILILSAGTGLLLSLAQSVVPIAAPRIAESLDADLTDLNLVTNALFLPLVALLVLGGLAADRYGRGRVYRFGMALVVLGAIGSMLAPTVEVLIAARLLEGVGAAFAIPTSLALLRSTFQGAALLRALAVWVGCAIGGAAFGPILGGILLDVGDWRLVFVPETLIALAALVGAAVLLRRPADRSTGAGQLHLTWNAALFVGLVVMMAGLVTVGQEVPIWGTVAAIVVGTLILAFVAARAGWLVGADPVPGAMRRLAVGILVAVLGLFAVTGVFFLSAIYLQRDLGFSPFVAAILLLPQTGLGAILAFFGGRVIGRFGLRRTIIGGFAIEAAGLFWLLMLDGSSGYLMLLPTQLAIAAIVAVVPTASLAIVLGSGPESRSGVLAGVQSSALNLGNLLSIAVLSVVIALSMPGRFEQALSEEVREVVPTVTGSRLAAGPNPVADSGSGTVRVEVAAAQRDAFAHAFGLAGVTAGLVSLGAMVLVWRSLRRPGD